MGTRITDQPPEHWAGPESLDPTPVWKQFFLIGVFLLVGLLLVGVVAAFALAPLVVTPPAVVVGARLVYHESEVGPAGSARLVGSPQVDAAQSLYLVRLRSGEIVALSAHWAPHPGDVGCTVELMPVSSNGAAFVAPCGDRNAMPTFDLAGKAVTGASRGLDRYLVSVTNDRVIVTLSRLIVSPERTSAPRSP
jgi:hypothetical protein